MDTQIWTEKYRPQKFEEIKGQKPIVERAKLFVKEKNMPNLLFAGPPGVGKTTLSLVIAKQLFKDSWKQNFLELNASDERGIDTVRIKLKDFARTKSISNAPFKIILLDECDSLTKEAQQALRRTMENFSQTCRFILSCNYSSKIIDPIQSRCTLFRFQLLKKEDITELINTIAKNENLKIDDKVHEILYEITEGDCRRIENILQSCAVISKNITEKLIFDIVSKAQPKSVKEVLEIATQGNFLKARDRMLEVMLKNGLSGIEIVKEIQKQIWNLDIEDTRKIELIDKCGEIEFRMVEGSDEFIQLEALLANFLK